VKQTTLALETLRKLVKTTRLSKSSLNLNCETVSIKSASLSNWTHLAVKKVVVKFVDELKTSLLAKGIHLNLSESVVDMLAVKGYDSKMGARPLSRKIDELIRVPLSKRILFDRLTDCDITADMVDDKVAFDVATRTVPVVADDGIIRFPDV
jgi:hypothetical protein